MLQTVKIEGSIDNNTAFFGKKQREGRGNNDEC
jgi:hypothetical protein